MSLSLTRYVLAAALRDRLVIAMAAVFILVIVLSVFSASAAIVESRAFVMVFAGGGMRMAGVLGLVLFACFFVRRSFESGDIELMLSRPYSRVVFIFSYGAAFAALALLTALAQGLALYVLAPDIFGAPHLLWVFSIAVENIIMVMTAFFFSMVLSNAALSCLAAFAFYVLGRMIGQIFGIIETGAAFPGRAVTQGVMDVVSVIIPRLDLMGQASWLIYGLEKNGPGFAFVLAQGALFILLVFLAILVDLRRRQF